MTDQEKLDQLRDANFTLRMALKGVAGKCASHASYFGSLQEDSENWKEIEIDEALDNIGGWYETQANGEVYYHAYNFLHFMAITYFPAMVLALPLTLVDKLNKYPASNPYRTA